MKILKTISIILLSLYSVLGISQKTYDKKYKEVNGYIIVQIGDKYGYISDQDVEIVPPIYQDAFNFDDMGFACVQLNDKFGWIDREGKLIIPCEYDTKTSITDEGLIAVSQGGKYGYINTKGKKVGKFDYDMVWPFTNGLGTVKKDELYGFVDPNGKVIIDLQYEGSYGFNSEHAGVKKDGKFGYINKKNEVTIPIIFESASRPINRFYVKVMNGDSLYGIYNILGTEKVPITNSVIYDYEKNHAAIFFRNGKYGLFDEKWNELLEPEYDDIYSFKDGFMPITKDNLYGFIDVENNKIIQPKYSEIGIFSGGISVVVENGLYGLINTKLQMIVETKYETYDTRIDDKVLMWKKKDETWDLTDLNGKLLLNSLTAIGDFNAEGVAKFERGEESGTVSNKGVVVIKQKSVKVNSTPIAYAKSNLTTIGGLSQLFYFTNVDTVDYSGGRQKHLASLRDGHDIVTLDSYADSLYTDGTSKYIGFRLSRFQLKNGNYELVSQSIKDTIQVEEFSNQAVGHDYNTFVKTDFGFLACGSNLIYAFDNDLNIIYKRHDEISTYLNAITIPGTKVIAVLTHDKYRKTVFGIRLIDYSNGNSRFTGLSMRPPLQQYDMYCGENNKILCVDKNHVFVAIIGHDRNAGQYFTKLDYSKLLIGEESIVWEKTFKTAYKQIMRISSVALNDKGVLTGTMRNGDLKETWGYFSGDFNANSIEEFEASLKMNWLIDIPSLRPSRIIPIHGDRLAIIAKGNENFGLNEFDVIAICDKELNVIGQYRLKTPEEEHVTSDWAINQQSFYDWRRATSIANQMTCKAAMFKTEIIYKDFSIGNFGRRFSTQEYTGNQQIWEVIDGDKTDELIIQTGTSLIKVNLNKYEECELRSTPFTWGKLFYEKGESKSGGSSVVVSNKTNTTSKTNTSATSKGPTTCTIINDLSVEQNGKYNQVKLAFQNYRIATTNISRGKSIEVDCDDVIVFIGQEKSTAPGKKLFDTKGKCGQTIKLSDFW